MRARAAVLSVAIAVPAVAGVATAGPLSLHSEDVHKAISGKVTSVRVDGDISSVKVTPGSATSVTAHLEWTQERPALSITVEKGVLTVQARCYDNLVNGPVVYIGGLDSCADDLTLVIPAAAALNVKTDGPLTVSGLTGKLDLAGSTTKVTDVHSSRVRVRSIASVTAERVSAPTTDIRSSQGSLTGRDISGRVVTFDTSYGDVDVAGVQARTLTLRSDQGSIALSKAQATVVDVSSDYGTLTLTDVTSPDVSAATDQGAITAQDIKGRHLALKTVYGQVGATDITADKVSVSSGQGTLTMRRLRGRQLTATSPYGDVLVDDAHLRQVTLHTDQGTVTTRLLDAPDVLRATTGYGDVNISVPTGRYYVAAHSSNGTTSVKGLVVDRFAKREIVATTDQGSVSVVGT
jgi:DUF4097 and DUF4098 domain-containing protein YvlB